MVTMTMPRPKEFDETVALDAAVEVFREHGFEGTSTEMLVQAMGIRRQSLYDTYGDKWRLYCSSLQRYALGETQAHVAALQSKSRAIDGIQAMMNRIVTNAAKACLGVSSVCEFGGTRKELAKIHAAARRAFYATLVERIAAAQAANDVAPDLKPNDAANFLIANIAGIRIAARGGASKEQLRTLGRLALRGLH